MPECLSVRRGLHLYCRSHVRALGRIRNPQGNVCLDVGYNSGDGGSVTVSQCGAGRGQRWLIVTKSADIRPIGNLEVCLAVDRTLTWCDRGGKGRQWYFKGHQLRDKRTNSCLTVGEGRNTIHLGTCSPNQDPKQIWLIDDEAPPQPGRGAQDGQ